MQEQRSTPSRRRTDDLYRLFLENVADYAIFMLSPEGRVESWNEGAERILGYREEEILGEHVSIFYPQEGLREGEPARELRTAVDEGRFEGVAWRVRRDGSRLWGSVVLSAIVDEEGRLIGIGQITRDLTERKEVARQYEESRQRYRSLFQYNPDAICSFDLQGRLRTANPAAERTCGYSAEELERISPLALVAPEDARRALRHFRRAVRGEAQQLEMGITHHDGHRVEARVTIFPIVVHGELFGVYAIAEDITERKRAEAEREELLRRERGARAEAEEASRAKSDFLAVMSHELRSPLNVITGYADLLCDGVAGELTPLQQRHLGKIRDSGRLLAGMIEQVLAFARMESGREAVHAEPVELGELVRGVAAVVEPLAREKGLVFRFEPPEERCVVRTDPVKARQVLLNLLSNAVKFTDAGEVYFHVRQGADGSVGMVVHDTGVGIDPEHLERIWEPFWQAEDPLRRRAEGAGLGLGIARRLARLLGGEIRVESAPGAGSTFTFLLPAG
jgi:PAS domain S-box-containing protein